MTTVTQFLNACRADLGYSEYPPGSNMTKFASCAGHANGNPWCATFLVCKAKQTGLHLPNYGAYTPTMAQAFKNAGRYGKTPRVGAFGFVYHPDLGRIGHVFVVEKVLANNYTIGINGNSNSGGSRTGGTVCRVERSPSYITYGYPVYSAPTTTTTTTTVHRNPYAVPVLSSSRPVLKQGAHMTANEVRWVQWAVGAKTDGAWGTLTTSAVKAKQRHFGIKDDGVVGPVTLSKFKTVTK